MASLLLFAGRKWWPTLGVWSDALNKVAIGGGVGGERSKDAVLAADVSREDLSSQEGGGEASCLAE